MDFIFNIINNSKLFAGCIMLLMNLGSRYISIDVPKSVDNIFSHPWFRRFFVFCVIFVSTRDVKLSILITLLFTLFFKFLLDENSNACIVPEKFKAKTKNPNEITEAQLEDAKRILKLHKSKLAKIIK